MASLKDKVIIITGSSQGIGATIAVHLSQFSPNLVLTARTTAKLEETSQRCQKAGLQKEKILTVQCDVDSESDLQNLVDTTIKKFGSIYGLVNNAGIARFPGSIKNSTMSGFDDVFRTNVRGPYFLSKICIPHLQQSKGCVVNISSTASKSGFVLCPAYSMTKAALDMFTHLLAAEVGPSGVRVNSVNPGFIQPEVPLPGMEAATKAVINNTPLGRVGTADDVASVVKFLLSDESRFMTGETLVVDGGRINPTFT